MAEGAKRPEAVGGQKVTHGAKKRPRRRKQKITTMAEGANRGRMAAGKSRNDKNETRAKDHYYEKRKGYWNEFA